MAKKPKVKRTRKAEASRNKMGKPVKSKKVASPKIAIVNKVTSKSLRARDYVPAKWESVIDPLVELDPLVALSPFSRPVKPFVASTQQSALFDWVKERWGGNVFVEAVAGSGKSTSLREGCKFMTSYNDSQWHTVQIVAFNTKIVREFQAKLDEAKRRGEVFPQVRINTFHSIGWGAWRRANPDCKIDDENKNKSMLDALNAPQHLRGIICKLVALAKNDAVYLDWQPHERSRWKEIIDHHDLEHDIAKPEDMDLAIDSAIEGLDWSRRVGNRLINFDDQIWLPVITPGITWWRNNWVLVDEAQDTNPIRRHLARKICDERYGRLVFVGDRHQAIYGFTGADADAVDLLKQEFKCKSMPLSVTYRCPKAVVREAQKYVRHITAHESAPEGIVRHVDKKELLAELPQLRPKIDAILCRNTRPLVSMAFRLIRLGIAAHVEGRSIGQGLIVLLERWRVKTTVQLRDRLDAYLERETIKLTEAKKEAQLASLTDKVETLHVLMEGCKEVTQVIDKIERLFADDEDGTSNTVTLSTIHKAKGREWDRVYILGFDRYMPSAWARQPWQMVQENNLIYVAITRAQRELVYTEALEDKKTK